MRLLLELDRPRACAESLLELDDPPLELEAELLPELLDDPPRDDELLPPPRDTA